MERTSRLLLRLETLSASILLRFRAIITVNMGFLNTNTAITWQLIRTARTLEAEWWQVCGEAWVLGQRKMSQVPGAFGLLDFTMLRPVLAWHALSNLWSIYFFNFPIFSPGYGKPRLLNPRLRRSACIKKIKNLFLRVKYLYVCLRNCTSF